MHASPNHEPFEPHMTVTSYVVIVELAMPWDGDLIELPDATPWHVSPAIIEAARTDVERFGSRSEPAAMQRLAAALRARYELLARAWPDTGSALAAIAQANREIRVAEIAADEIFGPRELAEIERIQAEAWASAGE